MRITFEYKYVIPWIKKKNKKGKREDKSLSNTTEERIWPRFYSTSCTRVDLRNESLYPEMLTHSGCSCDSYVNAYTFHAEYFSVTLSLKHSYG